MVLRFTRLRRDMRLTVGVLCLGLATPSTGGPITDRIYNPPIAPLSLDRLAPTAKLLKVRSEDGLELTGIVIPPRDKPILLILHGSGTSADDVGTWLGPVAENGYGLVLVEYRGFSGNPGQPSQAGLAMDARAFLREARALFPRHEVFVLGHSLGGGVAFDLALTEPADALITIGTFIGLREMAPPLARSLIKDRFDNIAALAKLKPELRYFLMHGTADEIIPPANANRLHNLAVKLKRPGATFILEGQRHRPEPALIASVLDYIVAIDAGARASPPVGTRVVPFR